jgi:MFS family permease
MGIGRFAFTPLMPLMIRDGHLDVSTGGWIAAANYAGYLVGALTASRFRWNARRLAALALASTAAATAAMAVNGSPWYWAALRFIAGVASAWAFVATAVWCLGALAVQRKPQLAGAVYSGVGVGIALAGLFCLFAASVGQTSADMWIELGLIAVALIVPVCFALAREQSNSGAPQAGPVTAARVQVSGTAPLVICYGALGFGYILPATFLPVMARAFVEDPRVFGLAWPLFGVTAALSTFVAARAMKRYSRLRVWAFSNLSMGTGVLLPSVWLNGWTIALSALGVGGTFMVITLAGVQEMRVRASGGDPTALVARMTAAFAIGQILGPVASSVLMYAPSLANAALNIALQLAAVSVFLAAAWLLLLDKRPALHPQEIVNVR